MARQKRDTKAILKTIARSERRSSLFWWMVEHHDHIIENARREAIDWRSVCADFAKRGLADTRGKPATEANARKTWQRVRRHVAESRATETAQPPPPVYPSRVDKEWRPANAPPPTGQTEQPELPAVLSPGQPNEFLPIRRIPSHEREPFDPKKQMARLRRIINERSGR